MQVSVSLTYFDKEDGGNLLIRISVRYTGESGVDCKEGPWILLEDHPKL